MNILIVDDEVHTVEWMQAAATSTFDDARPYSAYCIADAESLLGSVQFDIALVDLGLPDGDGTDLIRKIRQQQETCKVVVATIFDDDDHLFPALKAGARGYVLKQQSRDEIGAMLAGITRGRHPLSPSVAGRILDYFCGPASSVNEVSSESVALTDRELQVLELIAKGYTLAEAGQAIGIQRTTVATYVRRLYEKLEVSSRAEAATVAVQMGLIER